MVILRGCARCGGDILTGNAKNVRCVNTDTRQFSQIAIRSIFIASIDSYAFHSRHPSV